MVEQVQLPHSVVVGKKPLASEVVEGGLAVNLADYALYTKGYDGVVVRLNGTVVIANDNATAAEVYPTWVKEVGDKVVQYTSSAKLSFTPSTGQLRATSFAGDGGSLTGFTGEQIGDALGYDPVEPIGTALAAAASDLNTVITLANSLRAALVSCGIGT